MGNKKKSKKHQKKPENLIFKQKDSMKQPRNN